MSGLLAVGGVSRDQLDLLAVSEASLGRRAVHGCAHLSVDCGGTPVQLAHAQHRLLDRSEAARQPMQSASGDSSLVLSGQIYNHAELAEALGPPPGGWRSRSDTELLLEGLERHGPGFLERTVGDFGLVFVRNDPAEVIVARDRIGVRPLYSAERSDGAWAVGSTVRSVLATGLVRFELDPEGLESFLLLGSVWEPHTISRGVEPVAPGTWKQWRPGHGWQERRWWQIPQPSSEFSVAEAAERVHRILVDAVRCRIPRDLPLGAFVSGGTDSSSLAILVTEDCGQPLHSFSASFDEDDPSFSEARYQRMIAERCGTQHHEIEIRQADGLVAFEDFCAAMDQPALDGFNVYFGARAARAAGVEVCFSGDGGDEVFVGYHTFKTLPRYLAAISLLARLPRPLRAALAAPLYGLDRIRPLESRILKAAHLVRRVDDLADYYAMRRAVFLPDQIRRLLGSRETRRASRMIASPPDHPDVVTLYSAYEIANYSRNTHTRDADVFCSAHGVEIRFPYLDHRLIEAVFQVRGSAKVSPTEHKPLLQAVMGGRLPRFTWDRPKRGFTLPIQEWLRKGFLPDPDLSPWFEAAEVRKVIDGFRRNPQNRRSWSRAWSLAVLERCLQRSYSALG